MATKLRKYDFLQRFKILEKEVNKLPYYRRNNITPTKAQLKRAFRAKRLLTIMQNRFPVKITPIIYSDREAKSIKQCSLD